jgi:hypothetical protein
MKNLSLFVASWFFLVGSAIFTFEAILEIMRSTSVLSFAHFLACLLFTFGSWLFLQNANN